MSPRKFLGQGCHCSVASPLYRRLGFCAGQVSTCKVSSCGNQRKFLPGRQSVHYPADSGSQGWGKAHRSFLSLLYLAKQGQSSQRPDPHTHPISCEAQRRRNSTPSLTLASRMAVAKKAQAFSPGGSCSLVAIGRPCLSSSQGLE